MMRRGSRQDAWNLDVEAAALAQAGEFADAIQSSEDSAWMAGGPRTPQEGKSEAEYRLEYPVKCPACGERIETLKAIRLIRAQVNFTSTLPRRGRVLACPQCLAIIPAELSNF